MPIYTWSKTASDNAGNDPTINFREGQAPGSLNDSSRALMAAVAMYTADISGSIVTAGSSTAYTVASNSGFDTLAHMSGQIIAFSPHVTNGATVLLNVDGLGQKPLRSAPNVELLAGTIIQGTPYLCVYNSGDGAFYLQNFFGNPYNIPLGAGMDYWLGTAPNSSFVFPVGQAISRTTYATLFAAMGTTYGVGDGSTTFNLPDKVGRTSVMRDPSGTRITTNTFTSSDLGGVGGLERITLVTGNLPAYTPQGAVGTAGVHSGINQGTGSVVDVFQIPSAGNNEGAVNLTGIFSGTAQGGTSTPLTNIQPSAVCGYIIRII